MSKLAKERRWTPQTDTSEMSTHFGKIPYNTRMRRNLATFYTVITIIVLVTAAGVAVVRVASARDRNIAEATTVFASLVEHVEQTLEHDPREDAVFSDGVQTIVRSESSVLVFLVYVLDVGVEYVWARDGSFLPPSFERIDSIPTIAYSEVTQLRLTETVAFGRNALVVDGVFKILSDVDIYPIFRDLLIILVAFALVTVIVWIATAAGRASGTEHDFDISRRSTRDTRPRRGAPAGTSFAEPAAPPSPAPEPQKFSKSPKNSQEREVRPFVSPNSGVGFEEHLVRRLTLELERTAQMDQDLTLALARFPDAHRGSAIHSSCASTLVERFGFEDMIYEYGDDAFAVIIPGAELGPSVAQMDEMRTGIVTRPPVDSMPRPIIGLTSRNGRLLDGERMITEARSALRRAAAEHAGVVGFNPDPTKYRKFVTK